MFAITKNDFYQSKKPSKSQIKKINHFAKQENLIELPNGVFSWISVKHFLITTV